jgi:hypothetical protein
MTPIDVSKDVQNLIAEGTTEINTKVLNTLRQKHSDNDIVDAIVEGLSERVEAIRNKADKFARAIIKHSGNVPLHVLLKKALAYRNNPNAKISLTDSEFEFFKKHLYNALQGRRDETGQLMVAPVNTNIGRALGTYEMQFEGLNVEQGDVQHVQNILRQYSLSKPTYANVRIQSILYRDMAFEAISGQYDPTKHNAACTVSPVLAAMFLPKIDLFEETFLHANIAYIVRCRYEKVNRLTQADFKLLYSMISDPNDIVCDMESPFKDLLNRVLLQETVWQSVYALRSGRYYDCTAAAFSGAIDNCKIANIDAPDMIYQGDEGTVIRRLFQAFSLRPIIVATMPVFVAPIAGANISFPVQMNRVTAIPMINVRLPQMMSGDSEPISLINALSAPQYHFENNTLVPKTQSIIYTRGVLVYHVPRRTVAPEYKTILEPANWQQVMPTINGYERANPRLVQAEPYIDIGYSENARPEHRLYLRSVVAVNVNPAIPDLIVGTCALFAQQSDFTFGANATRFGMYNPQMATIRRQIDESSFEYQTPYTLLDQVNEEQQWRSFDHLSSKYGTIYIYAVDSVAPTIESRP